MIPLGIPIGLLLTSERAVPLAHLVRARATGTEPPRGEKPPPDETAR
ncbi:hypothetical protein ACFYTF_07445 [Nocardia thailandica]|uniref:Uncharacterized protein n=1 Tax=Nocardia thailandica TaxID=257275 RepID=A0ABW6PJT9_9NOCA